MTQRLNDKVDELQRLRTQNAEIERKLMDFHALFAQGQEGARSIVAAQLSGVDHETHEKVTAAGAREQDHTAEMDAVALQEPVDAAAVAGEAVNDATTVDQSRNSRPCSPDLQLAKSPKRRVPPPHAPPTQRLTPVRSCAQQHPRFEGLVRGW
jgi:hypothetical protein